MYVGNNLGAVELAPVGVPGALGIGVGGAYGGGFVGGALGGMVPPGVVVGPGGSLYGVNPAGGNGVVVTGNNGTLSAVDTSLINSAFGTAMLAGTDEDQVINRNDSVEFHIGIKDTSGSITTDGQGQRIIFNIPGKYLLQFTATILTDQSQEVITTFNSGSVPVTLKGLYERRVSTIAGREQAIANSTILVANQGTTMTVRVFVNPATISQGQGNIPVTVLSGARLIIHGLGDRAGF